MFSRHVFDAILHNSSSKEEFLKWYGKLKEGHSKEFCLLSLLELEKCVLDDNCQKLDSLSSVVGYIQEVEPVDVLADHFKNDTNPFRKSNLVIMACKHNNLNVLKRMINHPIVNSLSDGTGRDAFNDQDEMCHNAFYYAIRSGNIELLETLIEIWSGRYFNISLEDLEEIICSSFKELKLRRVPLSLDMEGYVINKVFHLRFQSNAPQSHKESQSVDKVLEIQTRIDTVIEKIELLVSEYKS